MSDHQDSEQTVSLRIYLENALASATLLSSSAIAELEKRMDGQFLAAKEAVAAALVTAEKAVSAALVAQDKQTQAAFIAAKEALVEAQSQLTQYKIQANEWRSTLNDLISKLMLRPEIVALFTAEGKALDAVRMTLEAKLASIESRVSSLEGTGQRLSGQKEASTEGHVQNQWTFAQVLAVVGLVLTAIAVGFAIIYRY